jgi:hypothetical protein
MPLEANAGVLRIGARSIPFPLRCQLLFGGVLNLLGWIFFGFGLVFFWVFALNADISSLSFRGEMETVHGIVTRSKKTRASENRQPVYANYYSFTANGKQFEGVSFATGRQLSSGETVKIQYLKNEPSKSRIERMRQKPFGSGALFVVIFPLIGIGLIAFGIKNGVTAICLLSDGNLAHGKLISKVKLAESKNGKPFYKLGFSFQAEDGQNYEVFSRTNATEKLEDDAFEQLVYCRWKPSDAVTLDNLPGSPRFDEMGNVRGGSFAGCIGVMIPPALTFIGHGAYIWLHFLS